MGARTRITTGCLALLVTMSAAAASATADSDGDGVADHQDNCVLLANPAQTDADGDGWGNRCDGDFNNDGSTDIVDLGLLKLNFFTANPVIDLNDDGVVNVVDLGILGTLNFAPPGPAGYANWVCGQGGDWNEPQNWFPAQVPPARAHVRIDCDGDFAIDFPDAAGSGVELAAASITSNQDLVLRGGSLTVDGAIEVAAALTLSGSELKLATIEDGGPGASVLVASTSTCQGCRLATDLTIADGAGLRAELFLELLGGNVFLAAEQHLADLYFPNFASILGTGTIWFAGSSAEDDANRVSGNQLQVRSGIDFVTLSAGGLIANADIQGSVLSDLPGRTVVMSNVVLRGPVVGENGGEIELRGAWQNVAGNTVTVTGGVLRLHGGWNNDGNIVLDNTPVIAGGAFTIDDLATLQTNSAITLAGQLDNTGNVLDIDSFGSGLLLDSAAEIVGGTLTSSGGLSITAALSGLSLSGLTLDTSLDLEPDTVVDTSMLTLAGDVVLRDGATLIGDEVELDGATVTIASDGQATSFAVSDVDGTGVIEFAGTTLADTDNKLGHAPGSGTAIGQGVQVRTVSAGGMVGSVGGDLFMAGSVESRLDGRTVWLGSQSVTLAGSLTIGAGGRVQAPDFAGAFGMRTTAAIDVEIGPSGAGELDVGTFDFAAAGTLNVAVVDGANPVECQLFDIVLHAAATGAFDSLVSPDPGNPYTAIVLSDATQIRAPGTDCDFEISRLPGVVESASSSQPGFDFPPRANDNDPGTDWCAQSTDSAPFLRFDFPEDVTVTRVSLGTERFAGHHFLTGRVRVLDQADAALFDSGILTLIDGDLFVDVAPDAAPASAVVFEGETFGPLTHCIAELDVFGDRFSP